MGIVVLSKLVDAVAKLGDPHYCRKVHCSEQLLDHVARIPFAQEVSQLSALKATVLHVYVERLAHALEVSLQLRITVLKNVLHGLLNKRRAKA